MKNNHQLRDNILYTTIYNVHTPATFKVSECDADAIMKHRWYYVKDARIVTTVVENSIEVTSTIESIIFNVGRKMALYKRNLDIFDYTRPNMSFLQSGKMNTILYEKDYAIMCLPNAQVAIIDLLDVDKIRPFYFRTSITKDTVRVDSQYINVSGKKSRIGLARLILGMNTTDSRHAVYKDGDIYNCRRSNLELRGPHNQFSNGELICP